MDPIVKKVYLCYLGDSLGYRTAMVLSMLEEGNKKFFETYSTNTDSILDFIRRGKELGLECF